MVALLGWLLYEWGPGNESVTPWLVARVLSANEGVRSLVLVPAVAGVFTFVQQSASGLTALYAFGAFDRTRAVAADRLAEGARLGDASPSAGALTATSVLLGTTVVALQHVLAVQRARTPADGGAVRLQGGRARNGARAVLVGAGGCGCVVALIGALVSLLAFAARSSPQMEPAAEAVIAFLAKPLVWLGVSVAYGAILLRPRRTGTG
jgi:hypothetical protein